MPWSVECAAWCRCRTQVTLTFSCSLRRYIILDVIVGMRRDGCWDMRARNVIGRLLLGLLLMSIPVPICVTYRLVIPRLQDGWMSVCIFFVVVLRPSLRLVHL